MSCSVDGSSCKGGTLVHLIYGSLVSLAPEVFVHWPRPAKRWLLQTPGRFSRVCCKWLVIHAGRNMIRVRRWIRVGTPASLTVGCNFYRHFQRLPIFSAPRVGANAVVRTCQT